ncbi:hypothetical protein ACFV00_30565 [Streptomyces californicus]|uniref:hypothetical protein n=1 Tax=Streptomyces californicus TaxID=67351 RepID=UPI0036C705D2
MTSTVSSEARAYAAGSTRASTRSRRSTEGAYEERAVNFARSTSSPLSRTGWATMSTVSTSPSSRRSAQPSVWTR